MIPKGGGLYRTLSQSILDHVPIGVFVVDASNAIAFWNHWLEQKTGISEEAVYGKRLEQVFPDLKKPRYQWAISQALKYRMPQVLSQALNRFLIPIPTPLGRRHDLSMMQQHIHIEPLLADDGRSYAVVTVIDVTDEVLRSSVLAELAQKLEHDSNRDPLTGLYNRRFMWEWLLQQLRLCSRTQHRLSCLMVDLDYFKKVNDRYGHDVGDRILKQFSEVIASQLRDADILVRYGGEEFAAFLPDCDMAQAMSTGWRFINILKHSQLTPLEKGSMTCSVGVATFHPEDPLTGEELLRLADQRLYKAKNSGRNRVVGDA